MVCSLQPCSLATKLNLSGTYKIAVQYFDLRAGISRYELLLNGRLVANWKADNILPPAVEDTHFDGHTSTRFITKPLRLQAGDTSNDS